MKVCDHLNLLEKDYYGLAIWDTPFRKVSYSSKVISSTEVTAKHTHKDSHRTTQTHTHAHALMSIFVSLDLAGPQQGDSQAGTR